MGIFDFFKSTPSNDAILAQVRKAKEIYAQPEYRRMAMEKLLKWDTPESLKGILERFSVVVQSPHWDDDEKRWLVDEFIRIGDRSLPLLKEFINNKNEVNHVLVAYRKIVNDDRAYRDMLMDALRLRPPSDHRSVQSKQELIAALEEFTEPEVYEFLLPYLNDHSDDVQCTTIDVLAKSDLPSVNNGLLTLLTSEVHSARVLRSAALVVENKKIPVADNIRLVDVVKEDFMIDKGQLVRLPHGQSH